MITRRRFIQAPAAVAVAAHIPPARAQASRSMIRFICPFAAGANYDFVTRSVADVVGKTLGRTAFVENRPGAGGLIAVKALLAAPADGSMSVLQTSSSFVSLPVFLKEANYDPLRDFTPVAAFVDTFSVILIHSSVPARNISELVAYGKANPGQLTAGSAGQNTSGDIWTAMFAKRAGIDILRVPYKGAAPMLMALEGGEVKIAITTYSEALRASVNAGRLRLVAVTSPRRVAMLPDVPTVLETVPGYSIDGNWIGLHAARGAPAAEVAAISGAVQKAVDDPEFRRKITGIFAEARYYSPDAFQAVVMATKTTWDRLAEELNVTAS